MFKCQSKSEHKEKPSHFHWCNSLNPKKIRRIRGGQRRHGKPIPSERVLRRGGAFIRAEPTLSSRLQGPASVQGIPSGEADQRREGDLRDADVRQEKDAHPRHAHQGPVLRVHDRRPNGNDSPISASDRNSNIFRQCWTDVRSRTCWPRRRGTPGSRRTRDRSNSSASVRRWSWRRSWEATRRPASRPPATRAPSSRGRRGRRTVSTPCSPRWRSCAPIRGATISWWSAPRRASTLSKVWLYSVIRLLTSLMLIYWRRRTILRSSFS